MSHPRHSVAVTLSRIISHQWWSNFNLVYEWKVV